MEKNLNNNRTVRFILQRFDKRALSTDGIMYTEDGIYLCDTAESPLTCLKPGNYKVKMIFRKKTLTKEIYLEDKKGNRVGMIRTGNGVFGRNQKADILVGRTLVPGVVFKSEAYFNKLLDVFDSHSKKRFTIILSII